LLNEKLWDELNWRAKKRTNSPSQFAGTGALKPFFCNDEISPLSLHEKLRHFHEIDVLTLWEDT
jgi:hypothetical protein